MKNKIHILLWLLLFISWCAWGAFVIYFESFLAFKVITFLMLLGVSYLIGFYAGLPWRSSPPLFFKKKFFWTVKCVLVFFIFCLLHYLNQTQRSGFDLTQQKLYQIRKSSQEILDMLSKKEKITFTFLGTRDQWQDYEELLNNYDAVSKNVDLKWINPDLEPEKMQVYAGRTLPTLLIESKSRRQWVDVIDEWTVSLALNSLKNKTSSQLCFINEHRELDLQSDANDGLKSFKEFLQAEGYTINVTNILDFSDAIGCKLLFIIGPKDDFLPSELKKLEQILKVIPTILALDPWQNSSSLKQLLQWMEKLGIRSTGAPLIDQTPLQYGEEAINVLWDSSMFESKESDFSQLSSLKGRSLWQMSTAFDIDIKNNIHVQTILQSSPFPKSWQENSWSQLSSGKVVFDETQDFKGPRTFVLNLKSEEIKSLLIMGSSRPWMNGFRSYPANMEMGLSFIHALLKDATAETHSVVLRDEKLWLHVEQANLIFYLSILVMPALLFLMAYWVFRQNDLRKN